MNKIILNIDGKDRLFRFDMFAMEILYSDGDESKIAFRGSLSFVAKMLYAGLAAGCNEKGIENDFTREDILNMVDTLSDGEAGRAMLSKISDCLVQSRAYKNLFEQATQAAAESAGDQENGEEKKTLPGMTLEPLPLVKSA